MQGSQLLINHYEPEDIFSIFIHEEQSSTSISEVTENLALLHL